MDENYIDIVRKSLYKTSRNKVGHSHSPEMPKEAKKIKFSVDRYNSETVFTKPKSEKIQNRKCTPFKKTDSKKKKVITPNGDSSFEDSSNSVHKLKHRKPTPFKNKVPRKRPQLVIFSSNEEYEDDSLSPSKSELELFQNTFKKSTKKKANIFDESSESEESVSEFNLERFFNSHDVSLNESITEAHSGIDHEFVSDFAEDAIITESDLSTSQRNGDYFQQEIEYEPKLEEDIVEIVDISDCDTEYVSNENTEAPVVTVLQESLVLDDEPVESAISISSSPQSQDKEYTGECNYPGHSAKYYNYNDSKLVILKEHQSVCVFGLFTLNVLHGKVEVLGNIIDRQSQEVNLYSPRGSALLCIKNITDTESMQKLMLNKIVKDIVLKETDITVEESSAIIECTKLDDIRISFIEKYISQQILPKIHHNNLPRVVFEKTENLNIIKENYRWHEILNDVEPSTKLLLTGGKGVGKSTFLRFAINRLLNKFEKVRVVDLDPGQSEFAVPGCVSIVTVTEPIFGPNYTHVLKATDRSLLSNINIGHDPEAYIKSIKHLLEYSETLEECPTLINYMGFVQGIGLNILSSAVTYIQPTDIVQIQSKYQKKNFKEDLSVETVQENCNMFANNFVPLDYKLHKVPAMNDDNEGWALEPRQSREMCVLSYLGQMMPHGVKSLISHELPMYEIKLSSIKVTNPRGEEISPAVANANLVALCSLAEESDIFECLGFGVVRGMDLDSDSLVLLTPEPPSILEQVYYLVIGSVTLPPSIYMTPDDVEGSIPYVMKGELVSLGQITKRSYLPVNKK